MKKISFIIVLLLVCLLYVNGISHLKQTLKKTNKILSQKQKPKQSELKPKQKPIQSTQKKKTSSQQKKKDDDIKGKGAFACPCKGAFDEKIITTTKEIEACLDKHGFGPYFGVSQVSYHHSYGDNIFKHEMTRNQKRLAGKDYGFLYCLYNGGGKGKSQKVLRHVAIAKATEKSYRRIGKRNSYEFTKKPVKDVKNAGICCSKGGKEQEACSYHKAGNCMPNGCQIIVWGRGNPDNSVDQHLYHPKQLPVDWSK